MLGSSPSMTMVGNEKGAWFPKRPYFFSNVVLRIAFIGAKNRAKIKRFLALTNPMKREAPS